MLLLRMGSCPKSQVRRISHIGSSARREFSQFAIQIQRNSQEQHPVKSDNQGEWHMHMLFMYKCISNKNDLIDSTNRRDYQYSHSTLVPLLKNTHWKPSKQPDSRPAGIPRVCVDICQLAWHSQPIKNVSDSSMKYATISYAVFFATWSGIPMMTMMMMGWWDGGMLRSEGSQRPWSN